jgi:hypothetical protein
MQAILDQLRADRLKLLEEGVLTGCWLSTSKPRGTASQGAKPHYQLRSRLPQFNGKKSRYVAAKEVAAIAAQIDRGRQLAAIDRQLRQLARLE